MRSLYLLLVSIVLVSLLSSCALQRKTSSAESTSDSNQIKVEFEKIHEALRADLKNIIREELMPEIQGLNSVPKAIREKQAKAKNTTINKIIIGRVEWIKLESNGIWLKARVDTGAQTSSLHANDIIEKKVDGKTYVQFETKDTRGKSQVFLKKVLKHSRVRSSNGELARRYVVKLKVTLGGMEHEINVNLNDRKDLEYNFLVGRNLLMDGYIVDVSQSRILGKQ